MNTEIGGVKGHGNIPGSGERKTKPIQRAVQELRAIGILPDVPVCRAVYLFEREIVEKCSTTRSLILTGARPRFREFIKAAKACNGVKE